MKTIKTILRTRAKSILSLLATIILALVCYGALAQTRRDNTHLKASNTATQSSTEECPTCGQHPGEVYENDPEFIRRRDEWLDRFIGSSQGDAFVKAQAAARSLPFSPLVGQWVFQSLSPMYNDWGHGGDPCMLPLPPSSPCGASARIQAIAVAPTNADVVYVGHEGGLAKSTDAGGHWSYLSNGFPSQSISAITIDPIQPNYIYVGTGVNDFFGQGISRSSDAGATWTSNLGGAQFTGKNVGKIAIDPRTAGSITSATLYASITGVINKARHHQIWKSTNSGTSWVLSNWDVTGAGAFYDIAIDGTTNPSTIYITAPTGLFKSTNGGTIWSSSIHPRGTPPEPTKPSVLALAPAVGFPRTLYVAFQQCTPVNNCNETVFVDKSTNGGSNWSELTPTAGNLYCFGVDPIHPDRIFVGGGLDLRYSLDGGISWLSSNPPPPGCSPHCVHVDMHSLAFCPSNSERNYLGTDGGIYRADNGGTGNPIIWWSKNENLAGSLMYGLSISSDDHIVIGTQDNGTQKGWVGSNPPWTFIKGGDGFKPKFDQNNSCKAYDTYYQCWVDLDPFHCAPCLWTCDQGNRDVTPRAAFGEPSSFFPAMFVAPTDSSRVLMGFRNVWRSIDSGTTWTRLGGRPCPTPAPSPSCDDILLANCGIEPSPTPGTATAIYESHSDPNTIYVVFDTLRLWVTSDSGGTWTNRTAGLPNGIQAVTVDPNDASTAYVSCNASNSGLYKTTDRGQSWSLRGFADIGCWDLAFDPATPSHLFVATGSGVYMSTDAGLHWSGTLAIPAGMAVSSLSFNATSRQLAASTYGRGAYVLDLDDVPPTVQITSPHNGDTVLGTITVKATASDNHRVGDVGFFIEDSNGQRSSIGDVTTPPYQAFWNTTQVSNGIYTLTATAHDPAGNTTTSAPVWVTVSN